MVAIWTAHCGPTPLATVTHPVVVALSVLVERDVEVCGLLFGFVLLRSMARNLITPPS
jgi:hypothetical protein